MYETLDDSGWHQISAGHRLAKTPAGLAELDTTEVHCADPKFFADQFVQAHASSNNISAGKRQVTDASMFIAERLDLLGFHKGDVLAKLIVPSKVLISFDAGSGDDADAVGLYLPAASWVREDAFDSQINTYRRVSGPRFNAKAP